jgi:hypothetical protein
MHKSCSISGHARLYETIMSFFQTIAIHLPLGAARRSFMYNSRLSMTGTEQSRQQASAAMPPMMLMQMIKPVMLPLPQSQIVGSGQLVSLPQDDMAASARDKVVRPSGRRAVFLAA